MKSGWTVRLDDPELVAGYVDFVVFANVLEEKDFVEPHSTVFSVEVILEDAARQRRARWVERHPNAR